VPRTSTPGKEDTPVDTPAATRVATPDPQSGSTTPGGGGGVRAAEQGSKRSQQNLLPRDESAERTGHVDTAASTECDDDDDEKPAEPGAGVCRFIVLQPSEFRRHSASTAAFLVRILIMQCRYVFHDSWQWIECHFRGTCGAWCVAMDSSWRLMFVLYQEEY
jgi:hypothetical protein